MEKNNIEYINYTASASELFTEEFLTNKIPSLFVQFPNPLDDSKNTIPESISTNTNDLNTAGENQDINIYAELWAELKFKDLFNNDPSVFGFWLDILSDDEHDLIVNKFISDTLIIDDITSNEKYIELYNLYINSNKNFEALLTNLYITAKNSFNQVENEQSSKLFCSDIFEQIDKNIEQLSELTIINDNEIIVCSDDFKKLIELRKHIILNRNYIDREIIYRLNNKTIFISILKLN